MADGLHAAKKYIATHRPESLEWGLSKSVLDHELQGPGTYHDK
jgi:hypothetical protein